MNARNENKRQFNTTLSYTEFTVYICRINWRFLSPPLHRSALTCSPTNVCSCKCKWRSHRLIKCKSAILSEYGFRCWRKSKIIPTSELPTEFTWITNWVCPANRTANRVDRVIIVDSNKWTGKPLAAEMNWNNLSNWDAIRPKDFW